MLYSGRKTWIWRISSSASVGKAVVTRSIPERGAPLRRTNKPWLCLFCFVFVFVCLLWGCCQAREEFSTIVLSSGMVISNWQSLKASTDRLIHAWNGAIPLGPLSVCFKNRPYLRPTCGIWEVWLQDIQSPLGTQFQLPRACWLFNPTPYQMSFCKVKPLVFRIGVLEVNWSECLKDRSKYPNHWLKKQNKEMREWGRSSLPILKTHLLYFF